VTVASTGSERRKGAGLLARAIDTVELDGAGFEVAIGEAIRRLRERAG